LALSSTERDLELARLADAVNLDLSGERSNLSGRILYTDTSVPGERTVHVMLASGTSDKMVSPAGAFAVSGDFGPGGVPFFGMGLPGQMLSIHATGVVAPLHVNVTGSLQAIAFSPDGEKAAVVSGDGSGGAVFAGHLEGIMTRLATRGMAITPAVGPAGEIAYAAGEPGALHVFIDDKQVAPAGISPAFCDKGKQHRLAFAVMGGGVQIVSRDGGGFLGGVSGGTPACSADGRTLAVVRHGKSGGIFLVNDEALGAVKIHAGDAAGLRWSAGGVLPPEG